MSDTSTQPGQSVPQVARINMKDIRDVLALGLRDFRAAPQFGAFFSMVYVLGGIGLVALGAGTMTWTLVLSLGFPLIAPFAAVGLYEVSRRLEAGQPLDWRSVLGVVLAERKRQVPWIGAIIVIAFLFWTFLAHMIFALFMGLSAITNISSSYEAFLTTNGLTMLGVEAIVGFAFALFMFCIAVVSLPLALDREIDFVTAMLTSIKVVKGNFPIMFVWAVVIAGCVLISMIPIFLGLFLSLPVLGHASWHMYRRALK
ncbi:DUF2189 domain-containing protein [Actibacterium pelagium]|uniref:Membrane protein n=1 Tax=Actibacterium pelagium TaxID=2029103 RepID=A0A917EJW6_9RHOB|nr:DUF2189 domain-containing protein [Actibacterium pelagium]GGE45250.1 membrane protein [Actibacterium pelagium]